MMNKIDCIWQFLADTSLRLIDQTKKRAGTLLLTPFEQTPCRAFIQMNNDK
jgi:hypothetical protein